MFQTSLVEDVGCRMSQSSRNTNNMERWSRSSVTRQRAVSYLTYLVSWEVGYGSISNTQRKQMNLFFLSDTIIQWDPVFFCAMLRYCVIFSKIIQDQDPIMIQHYQGINMESSFWIRVSTCATTLNHLPIGSMYAIYGNVYHQYTPNVSIYTIHESYGLRI